VTTYSDMGVVVSCCLTDFTWNKVRNVGTPGSAHIPKSFSPLVVTHLDSVQFGFKFQH
jgi:hypothetical protein